MERKKGDRSVAWFAIVAGCMFVFLAFTSRSEPIIPNPIAWIFYSLPHIVSQIFFLIFGLGFLYFGYVRLKR